MRLFVALDVSEETRAQLRRVRAALEPQLRRGTRPPRLTWVRDAAAHITLRFIGEVSEDVATRVCVALAAPINQAPYSLRFAGVGAFPRHGPPRVVWIGVAQGQDTTARLAADVARRLEPVVGVDREREFRAHLTVARVKDPGRMDWSAALRAVDARVSVSLIDHVTLYSSRTLPEGPAYTALLMIPLRPGN